MQLAPHAAPPKPKAVTVTVILHPATPIDPKTRITRAQLAATSAPSPAAVRIAKAFAAEFALKAAQHPSASRRSLSLTGSETAMQKAFGVTLSHHEIGGKPCRCREGVITLPEELAPHVQAVLGLDTRPQAQPHFRVAKPHASNVSYTPVQVAQLYGFPTNSASGQTIGILELGGGYRTADLTAYFQSLGLTAPKVTAVSVDGGKNSPSTADGADGEVMLDIEVAASVAQGANVVVYFATNTDQGFIDAILTAVHDTTNKPSVLSISWGGPESSWTAQSTTALDQACQAAAAVGVTITVAAGDDGSTDGVTDGANHVDFPASSPNVLACGGTKLTGNGSTIASEVVWNELASGEGATGGGVSTIFPLPAWQTTAGVPSSGRGVPDVAGNADPSTGYEIRVDGQTSVIGGTSAVAPLWAGLITLVNAQNKTSVGFVNPTLYKSPGAFHDILSGNNGSYKAGPGWDACTGLGSPIGGSIVQAFSSAAPIKKPAKPKKPKKPVKKS